MGREKKDTAEFTEEDIMNEVTNKLPTTFPQITSTCKIKSILLKKGGQDIRFEDFRVSEGRTELLDSLINTGEEVQVTISAIQGRLRGIE